MVTETKIIWQQVQLVSISTDRVGKDKDLRLILSTSEGEEEWGKVFKLSIENILIHIESLSSSAPAKDQDTLGFGNSYPHTFLELAIEGLVAGANYKEFKVFSYVCRDLASMV